MKSSFLTLFAMLFLAATFFSCETDEPAPRPTWGEIVNPIEAFMYPRDIKVYADDDDGRRWLILVLPDSTKSSFAPPRKARLRKWRAIRNFPNLWAIRLSRW